MDNMVILIMFMFVFMFMFMFMFVFMFMFMFMVMVMVMVLVTVTVMVMVNPPSDDGLPEEEEPVVPRLLIKHREHMPVPVPQAFYLERNKYRSSDRIRVLRGEGEGVSWYRND